MRWDRILALGAVVVAVVLLLLVTVAPVFSGIPGADKYLPLIKGINLGLDLQGGVHVIIEGKDTEEVKVTPETMKQLRAVIQNRVDQFGVSEPVIQQLGDRRLIIELAGIDNPEEAVDTMVKVAFLEFKDPSGETIVTGKDLKNAQEARDPVSGVAEVNLEFGSEGTKKFAQATTANVGKPISIVLDGNIIQAPTVKEPITDGKARISPYESLEEAHNYAILLRSGALPLKVEVVEKRTVGPALGSDSLSKSKHAGAVGLIAILVFMLMYYRLPGLVASFALSIYAVVVILIFMAMHVTMTLPGIAGFLLSLGIAVDANVIIFERVKEEMRAGKSLHAAIEAGFKRGFVAVFDANATTVLAAAVLIFFGTGPVKGFAITLIIGIIVSMLTAISLTRWLLHLVASTNLVKKPKYFGV